MSSSVAISRLRVRPIIAWAVGYSRDHKTRPAICAVCTPREKGVMSHHSAEPITVGVGAYHRRLITGCPPMHADRRRCHRARRAHHPCLRRATATTAPMRRVRTRTAELDGAALEATLVEVVHEPAAPARPIVIPGLSSICHRRRRVFAGKGAAGADLPSWRELFRVAHRRASGVGECE